MLPGGGNAGPAAAAWRRARAVLLEIVAASSPHSADHKTAEDGSCTKHDGWIWRAASAPGNYGHVQTLKSGRNAIRLLAKGREAKSLKGSHQRGRTAAPSVPAESSTPRGALRGRGGSSYARLASALEAALPLGSASAREILRRHEFAGVAAFVWSSSPSSPPIGRPVFERRLT